MTITGMIMNMVTVTEWLISSVTWLLLPSYRCLATLTEQFDINFQDLAAKTVAISIITCLA